MLTLPELAWRGPPLYPWRSSMDTLGVHTHLRVFHAHRGEFIGYLPPKTHILPRLRLYRDIQRPSGGKRPPHNGHRLPCAAGNGYVRSASSRICFLNIIRVRRCCDECPLRDRHDTDNMPRPGRAQRRVRRIRSRRDSGKRLRLCHRRRPHRPHIMALEYVAVPRRLRLINLHRFPVVQFLVHFVIAIMVIPAAGAAWFLLPTHTMPAKAQRRGVDIPGVLVLTSGLILFVYAISDSAESGMSSLSPISSFS